MTPEEKQQLNDVSKKLDDLIFLYNKENFPNRIDTNRTLVLRDVENKVEFDNFAGVKIGHSTSKVGLYGTTPVVRASAISAPNTQGSTYSQADVQSIVTAVNSIRTAIKNFGITL